MRSSSRTSPKTRTTSSASPHVGRERDRGYGFTMAAHVKMYTRKWCGYCTAAERLLETKGVAYEQIDCTGDHQTRRWLVETTGRTTVPQIFINGKAIGGYDDLKLLDRKGELDKMLWDQPAASATES
jgi:glutaredoxin 3